MLCVCFQSYLQNRRLIFFPKSRRTRTREKQKLSLTLSPPPFCSRLLFRSPPLLACFPLLPRLLPAAPALASRCSCACFPLLPRLLPAAPALSFPLLPRLLLLLASRSIPRGLKRRRFSHVSARLFHSGLCPARAEPRLVGVGLRVARRGARARAQINAVLFNARSSASLSSPFFFTTTRADSRFASEAAYRLRPSVALAKPMTQLVRWSRLPVLNPSIN